MIIHAGLFFMKQKKKLTAIQPTNLAQASRISGINPSDIAALLVQLSR